jgi:hypothetical protein
LRIQAPLSKENKKNPSEAKKKNIYIFCRKVDKIYYNNNGEGFW